MVARSEVITISRQIGGMMEAGVDILRITRVLRAQTGNPRLLEVYNALDHDLTMGRSLAEAMAAAPDVWSPFAVSLVQQGESRNDIAGAFNKIADFLQKDDEQEAALHREHPAVAAGGEHAEGLAGRPAAIGAPMAVIALDGLIDRLQTIGLRFLTVISGLLLALASVWLSVEQGWIEQRWINVTLCSVAALFIGGMGVWVQRRINADRRREARCSFCGTHSPGGEGLERAPRFAGAAICVRCAAIVARRHSQAVEEGADTGPLANGNTARAAEVKTSAGGSAADSPRPAPSSTAQPPRAQPVAVRRTAGAPPDGEEDYE